MSVQSHAYLHLASIGVAETAATVQAELGAVLAAMYERGEIQGYRLHTLDDREAAEDELVHYIFDFEAVTQKRYPFVFALLTPLETAGSGPAIDQVMEQRGFRRVA